MSLTTTHDIFAQARGATPSGTSDEELVRSLPGYRNSYAEVNGVRLHYVEGGAGQPLILLPGWPQTWWQFSRIMPDLAKRYRIIAVDLRGMGGSSKPRDGYDKKTMAADIYGLVRKLGYDRLRRLEGAADCATPGKSAASHKIDYVKSPRVTSLGSEPYTH